MRLLLNAAAVALAGLASNAAITGIGAGAQVAVPPPATVGAPVRCARFAESSSTAFDPVAKRIQLPWRGDLPTSLSAKPHAWDQIKLDDWQAYLAAVLSEIRAAQPKITGNRLTMAADASWWISPWMDFTSNGREPIHGLTRERSPDPGDVGPNAPGGLQVWAVGFYNAEGAYGLQQVFADPCNPKIPSPGWTFSANSASFKFLFTNGDEKAIPYIAGSPQIEAYIDSPGGNRTKQIVRLLQVDISVRDTSSPTGWVFGTFVWKGPAKGDGLMDNLEPVGLMWGNDPTADATPRDAFAPLQQSHLNMSLAGHVWRGPGQKWDQRPWPGFQGRLNGPADNFRSSCLSCHALAQWPRSPIGIVPTGADVSLSALDQPAKRAALRQAYMQNVVGGTLTRPQDAQPSADRDGAVPLDYSLQIEAGFTRICSACANGALTGATPAMCKVKRPPPAKVITAAVCPAPQLKTMYNLRPKAIGDEPPPRQ